IVSIDAVEPDALIRRNSVAEIDGLKTVYGFIAGCVASGVGITFLGGGSSVWLERAIDMNRVVPFAFIDGKHTTQQVRYEARALSQLQRTGDMVIFDDCQLMPVAAAVGELTTYDVRYIDIGCRVYAVATRL
ncbi:MAG: hypothetical protein IT564_11285, partial [Rhodospirillales bacterium]|nr:hypothetical protein [Rhodospirillales bacterium]